MQKLQNEIHSEWGEWSIKASSWIKWNSSWNIMEDEKYKSNFIEL